VLVTTTATVVAGPDPWNPVSWPSDQPCAEAFDPKGDLAAWLGDEAETRSAGLLAAIESRQDDGHFVLELELHTSSEVRARTLRSTSCDELRAAVVLILAVAADPIAVARAARVESEGNDPHETAKIDVTPTDAELERAPIVVHSMTRSTDALVTARWDEGERVTSESRQRRPRHAEVPLEFGVTALGGATYGPAAEISPSVALGVSVSRRPLRVELDLQFDVPRGVVRIPEVDLDLWTLSGTLLACYVPMVRTVTFPLCAGGSAGFLRVTADRLQQSAQAFTPWSTVVGSAQVTWRLNRNLAVGARVHGFVSVVRPSYFIDGTHRVFHAQPGGARVFLLVEGVFHPRGAKP